MDVATNAAHIAAVDEFIDANQNCTQWHWVSFSGFERRVTATILGHKVAGTGDEYRTIFEAEGCGLVVAVIENVKEVAPGGAVSFSYLPVPGSTSSDRPTCMPGYLWMTARRRFSLPGDRFVEGPYLAIFAVKHATAPTQKAEIIRCRLWPVFFAPSGDIAIVRSNNERAAICAHNRHGAVCFTPTHKFQIARLQASLGGRRWKGDLSIVTHLFDILLAPHDMGPPGVEEIWGLRHETYTCSRTHKRGDYLQVSPCSIRFLEIDVAQHRAASAEYIDRCVFNMLLDAPGAWCPAAVRKAC